LLTFDKKFWEEKIRQPDWYFDYVDFAQKAKGSENREDLKEQVRDFFEEALTKNKVALSESGPNLDKERLPIDTVVIHHTSGEPGYALPRMNAVQLLNIYAPYYANPTVIEERNLKGRAVWSGHFLNDKQSFIGYHWLMRMDGSFEKLLDDDKIGWHAGKWDINKRSVAICLDNDYENQDPTDKILQKLAEFIKENYSKVQPNNIIGHCEAREGTICPGSNFKSEWKERLIYQLKKS
jgi:N-acetyl-anhydromuramyl-L-alanine amidase AmpD